MSTRENIRLIARAPFQRKTAIIFLSISLKMCSGCSKEQSHGDDSFEYPHHMFWLRNKKTNFLLSSLIWGPAVLKPGLKKILKTFTVQTFSFIFSSEKYLGAYYNCNLKTAMTFIFQTN